MVKILLIQLDRFGDNLFVVPLIKGIKNRYPDSHITVLVREELMDILGSYKEVDAVRIADWLDLPAMLRGIDESEMIVLGYSSLKQEIKSLRKSDFNRLFNLNFNKITTLTSTMLNIPDTVGFTAGSDGDRLIKGFWANYMGCVVQNRKYNSIHIVDVYRNFEHGISAEDMSGFNIDKSSEDYAESLFKEEGLSNRTHVIAFQPGASNRRRIWPARKFASLAGQLSQEGLKVIILGTKGEKDISQKIKDDNPEVIDLTGKTTFHQLAAVLRRCNLLVSNDTGTAHLASAVGTRVIGLYMCHAYPLETGPYGRGHLTISPVLDCYPCKWKEECPYDFKCRNYIDPEDVYSVINWTLSPGKLLSCNPKVPEVINVNISIFDEDGFVSYIPLVKRALKSEDLYRLAYKRLWKEMSDKEGKLHVSASEMQWLRETYDIINVDCFDKDIEEVISLIGNLESLAEQGFQKTVELLAYIFSPDRKDMRCIQSGMEGFSDLDSLIAEMGRESEKVSPLTNFFQMQKGNIQGGNPIQILRDTGEAYSNLKLYSSRFSSIIRDVMTAVLQNNGMVNV